MDHCQMDQLSVWVSYAINGMMERSDKTGIERDFVDILLALVPRGVSFSTCCTMYNQVQRAGQARREHGHYVCLAEQVETATLKIGQVCIAASAVP